MLQCCPWKTGGWHVEDNYVVGRQVGGVQRTYLQLCCCGKTGGWHVQDIFTAVLLLEDRWVACRGHVHRSSVQERQVGGM